MRSHTPHAFLVMGKRDAGCDAPVKESFFSIFLMGFEVVNFRVNHTPMVLTRGNPERCRRMARLPKPIFKGLWKHGSFTYIS